SESVVFVLVYVDRALRGLGLKDMIGTVECFCLKEQFCSRNSYVSRWAAYLWQVQRALATCFRKRAFREPLSADLHSPPRRHPSVLEATDLETTILRFKLSNRLRNIVRSP